MSSDIIGSIDEFSEDRVVGWAFDQKKFPERALLTIFVNGMELGKCVANRPRPGLGNAIGQPGHDDFAFEFVFRPRLRLFNENCLQVITESGTPLDPATASQTRTNLLARRRPVLVTSEGRSGTTFLMHQLLQHPEILIADIYPYEVRLINYYASVIKVLTSTKYPEIEEIDFVENASSNLLAGPNPWNNPALYDLGERTQLTRFFLSEIPKKLIATFGEFVDRYYDALSESKPTAKHFVEKSSLDEDIRFCSRKMFPDALELILVRDPRDFWCSGRAFWKRDETELRNMIKRTYNRLLKISDEQDSCILFVKYEDLISNTRATLDIIFESIGLITPSGDPADGSENLFKTHATSQSPQNSIGRWKSELKTSELEFFDSEFSEFLNHFDYEPF